MTEAEVYAVFSKNLRYLRKKKGLSQKNMAEIIEADRSSYTYYELGRVRPSIYKLLKIANFHKVSINKLISSDMEETDKE